MTTRWPRRRRRSSARGDAEAGGPLRQLIVLYQHVRTWRDNHQQFPKTHLGISPVPERPTVSLSGSASAVDIAHDLRKTHERPDRAALRGPARHASPRRPRALQARWRSTSTWPTRRLAQCSRSTRPCRTGSTSGWGSAARLSDRRARGRDRGGPRAVHGSRCIVGLIDGGEIVHERGLGLMAADRGDPVTPATLFQACSISKPVAALAMFGSSTAGSSISTRMSTTGSPRGGCRRWRAGSRSSRCVSSSAIAPGSRRPASPATARAPRCQPRSRCSTASGRRTRSPCGSTPSGPPVPLLGRWDDGNAAAARGRHRDAAPRARARAGAGTAPDARQRLRPALAGGHPRSRRDRARRGRARDRGALAHVPRARGRGPLDDAGRPSALRDRDPARVRVQRRRAALSRTRARALDAPDRRRRPDRGPQPARSRAVSAAPGRRAGSATRAATWAFAVTSSPTGTRARVPW